MSSNQNDVVLDPFAGTGTVNIACKNLSRYCTGMELNPKFCKAAQNRLNTI
ncbi:MAG: DNA methyltransferase [Promethearchaeota archaeon]